MYIAFDLETTGFSPTNDKIIEVGAILFDGSNTEFASFTSLINPQQPINPKAIAVHGITDAMVAVAPTIQDMMIVLQSFIGDHPIIGHNIQFDISFLKAASIYRGNQTIDTLALAKKLTLPKYNLTFLAQQFNIIQPTHRALDDARTTKELFMRLN